YELLLEELLDRRDLPRRLLSDLTIDDRPVGRITVFPVDAEGNPAKPGVRAPRLVDLVEEFDVSLELRVDRVGFRVEHVQIPPLVVQHPEFFRSSWPHAETVAPRVVSVRKAPGAAARRAGIPIFRAFLRRFGRHVLQ